MRDEGIRLGLPADAIKCLTVSSLEGTEALMRHKKTAVILATGGTGLVRAAYSSGKPAFGVGPGKDVYKRQITLRTPYDQFSITVHTSSTGAD